jgi:DNA recombination protein RmuC
MEPLLFIIIILLLAALAALAFLLLRKSQGGGDLPAALQNFTQSLQSAQGQSAVLGEKIAGLADRMANIERGQGQANQNLSSLGAGLAETGAVAKGLADSAAAIRQELTRAKNDLIILHTQAQARMQMEERTAESIRRLEAIIAGTQSKGAAGENLVEIIFAQLPAEWQVRNFTVGNKVVEFGLRLPNNLVLPIDSKWTATSLLEQFAACEEAGERQKLKTQIEGAVLEKAKEIRKYINPDVTASFGVAAVPDAVQDLCAGIQCEVFRMNVVLVSYSMLVPYLLLVFQTILKTGPSLDLHKLEAYLHSAQENLRALQEELEGRFAKGLKMLDNSRTEMSAHLSKLSGGLTGLQIGAGTGETIPSEEGQPALP